MFVVVRGCLLIVNTLFQYLGLASLTVPEITLPVTYSNNHYSQDGKHLAIVSQKRSNPTKKAILQSNRHVNTVVIFKIDDSSTPLKSRT